ncbi:CT620/CT621 family type III secretion system effector [Candidatus Chlamydia sanziniae]|uniref:Effector from type III secretion system family protein n=1 Tax=Candidatus Chlamydia sanziniae TaxID=1806891 RepID=A0A1A9HUH7_9CHLA|nr:CT620/CT621 family type III secretion system effector [Candidatus Chlamydia sanziniae]ANH78648.1 hypothetical protein Cs308_0477 [Candidatus Chlamydia sanziniae]
MTIQSYYINFTRNVTASLIGTQIDPVIQLSDAALFFQELYTKAQSLKHALKLVQELDAKSVANPLVSIVPLPTGHEDVSSQALPLGTITIPFPDYTDAQLKDIISHPDLSSAQIFIDGMEKVLANWLLSITSNINIVPLSEAEEEIVTKYQKHLRDLKPLFSTGTTPSGANYKDLYGIPTALLEEIATLPVKDSPPKSRTVAFWQDMMVVYSAITSINFPANEYLNTQLAERSLNISTAQTMQQLLRNFYSNLKDFLTPLWEETKAKTSIQVEYNARNSGIIQSWLNLGGIFRLLTENLPQGTPTSLPLNLSNTIYTFLNAMGDIVIGSGSQGSIRLDAFLGIQYVYQRCAFLYGTSASAPSTSDYTNFLNADRAYWKARARTFDVTGNGVFDHFASNWLAPGYKGLTIFNKNQLNQYNPRFFQEALNLVKNKPMDQSNYQKVADAANTAINSINNLIKIWNTEIVSIQSQKESIDPPQLKYYETMLENKKTFVNSTPLQSTYTSLMLDKFLPMQQHVLSALGDQMTFSNKAAKYLNTLISKITSFQTSDVYYSLSIYLRQMNLQALIDPIRKAITVLNNEKTRCMTDIKRAQQVQSEINKIIPEVQANLEMTSSQKRELVTTLTSYKSQFDDLIRNLSQLLVFLVGMSIDPVANPKAVDKAFDVTIYKEASDSWIRQLASFESFVIEGGHHGVVPGGEQQILQAMESSAEDFTTFNQNQQLALQLESSAMQQEWTIVSTALALLNQMFSKLARRINS